MSFKTFQTDCSSAGGQVTESPITFSRSLDRKEVRYRPIICYIHQDPVMPSSKTRTCWNIFREVCWYSVSKKCHWIKNIFQIVKWVLSALWRPCLILFSTHSVTVESAVWTVWLAFSSNNYSKEAHEVFTIKWRRNMYIQSTVSLS